MYKSISSPAPCFPPSWLISLMEESHVERGRLLALSTDAALGAPYSKSGGAASVVDLVRPGPRFVVIPPVHCPW